MQITLERLRNALGAQLGSVLTPELAAQIEFMAFDRIDRSYPPSLFPPAGYRNLTFQVEHFRDILDELQPLHEAHFAETEKHLQGFELKPNLSYLCERERQGTMIQFTARDGAKLAGNIRMYIGTSLHTGNKFAEEDTFFLLPEYRKGFCALAFLRWVEKCLVEMVGVREIRANSKVVNNAHRLMDYRGYTHFANSYVKIFS